MSDSEVKSKEDGFLKLVSNHASSSHNLMGEM